MRELVFRFPLVVWALRLNPFRIFLRLCQLFYLPNAHKWHKIIIFVREKPLKRPIPHGMYGITRNTRRMEQVRSISKEQVIMTFVATCIETTARYLNADYREVFDRMERIGMIDDYILPNYEPLHSESREVLAERLVECLTNWEAQP